MTIEQDGGMRDERTPYDDELARLHDELGATAVGYGVHGGRVSAATDRGLAGAGLGQGGTRAVPGGQGQGGRRQGRPAGGRRASGTVKLEDLSPEELPAELRA